MEPLMEALRPTADDFARLELPTALLEEGEFRPLRDTQQIPLAVGASQDFFNTAAKSSRLLNDFKETGCTLHNPGLVPDKEHYIVVAVGVAALGIVAGDANAIQDYNQILDGGILHEVSINEKLAVRALALDECAENRGVDAVLHNRLATAVAIHGLNMGTGNTRYGRILSLPERKRFIVRGGESIRATIVRNGPAVLTAATRYLRLSFYGWRYRS